MINVSVIIPTYNRLELLSRAIHSVLNQTVMPGEIIIVDDGSTDNTVSYIKQHHPKIILLHQDHAGVSRARNLGIRNARYDWIAMLDSDDEWMPDKLEHQLNVLDANTDYLFCHTNEIWIRNGQQINQKKIHRKYGGHIFRYCLPRCVISPSSALVNRSIFTEIGLFDETLPVCEDYDLWLRICARYPVLYIEKPLLKKYGGHSDQLSQQYWGMDRFRILALDKIISANYLDEDDYQAAINTLLDKINIYLKGAEKHGTIKYVSHFKKLQQKFSCDLVSN